MCPIDSIPYLREIVLAVLFVVILLSFFKKDKCPCSQEIQDLKDEIADLKKSNQ